MYPENTAKFAFSRVRSKDPCDLMTSPPLTPSETSVVANVQDTPTSFNSDVGYYSIETMSSIQLAVNRELLDMEEVEFDYAMRSLFEEKRAEVIMQYFETSYDAPWKWQPGACDQDSIAAYLTRCFETINNVATTHGLPPPRKSKLKTWYFPNHAPTGSESQPKPDFALTHDEDDVEYDWGYFAHAFEFKPEKLDKTAVRQLGRYSREMFRAQPTRCFVSGLVICGFEVRYCQFDRCSGFTTRAISMLHDGKKFTQLLINLIMMNSVEKGFDPTIVESPNHHITFMKDDVSHTVILEKVIARANAIKSRGTTCYSGRSLSGTLVEPCIVKDSWQYSERPEEGVMLKKLLGCGATNIGRYYFHYDPLYGGDSIDVRRFVRKGLSGPKFFDRNARKTPSQGTSLMSGVETTTTTNRVFRRLILRDHGVSLLRARTAPALLRGICGGIKGHKSAYNHGVLHRDISVGNILLNESQDDGLLIDFDLAINVHRDENSGAPEKTGTRLFMAISLLGDDEMSPCHSVMHDLESFYWVFLWLAIHWRAGSGKVESLVKDWKKKLEEGHDEFLETWKISVALDDRKLRLVIRKHVPQENLVLVDCLRRMRTLVFPHNTYWTGEESLDSDHCRELHDNLIEMLTEAAADLERQ